VQEVNMYVMKKLCEVGLSKVSEPVAKTVVKVARKAPAVVAKVKDVVVVKAVSKRGRPPIGEVAMTPAEKQKRYRQNRKK
jgi:hypothetical protein